MQDPAYDQSDYRGRNDDGSETSATWKASTNTDYEINPAQSTNHRVRIAVTEGNGVKDSNVAFRLQYSKNGGAWTDVGTATSNVQAAGSTNVSDGTQTTQQITTNTFAGGELAVGDAVAGDNTAIDFAGGDTAEVEFSIEIIDADVAQADTIDLRVTQDDGTVLSSYTNTPTVTVNYNETVNAAVAATTATALTASATERKTISGTCTLNGSGVQATVEILNADVPRMNATTTAASDGSWSQDVPTGYTYHVAARYDDGSTKYNEYSNPFLVV